MNALLPLWAVVNNFLVAIVIFAALFLFARSVGRGAFVALLLSFYAAYALYAVFPFASFLPTAPASTAFFAHAALYAVLVFLFFLILRRVIVSDFLFIGPFALILLAFFGTGFLIALATHAFAITSFYQFTPAVSSLFAPASLFFWWFIAPAVGLFFLAR